MDVLQNLNWFLDTRSLLLGVLILLVLCWRLRRPKTLPPGPWEVPLLGSLPAIVLDLLRDSDLHRLLVRYAAKFGPMFRLNVSNKTLVVLSDYATVREAFQHPQLTDRPETLFLHIGVNGVGTVSGELWLELRRFCLTILRSFGVGKSSFQEIIATEAEEVMKEMARHKRTPFDPKPLLSNAVSNVICSVIFGKRYEYSDREFTHLLKLLSVNTNLLGPGGVMNFFPEVRHLPLLPVGRLLSNFEEIIKFTQNVIDVHRAEFDADNLKDFTDAYLMEIRHNLDNVDAAVGTTSNGRRAESKAAKYGHLSDHNIIGTILTLFAAGSETTATTLQWCLLYMAVYPDVQRRVQAEIDSVVGRNRMPRMSDKPLLNFTQAVLWEVQRLACVVALGIPHAAASDTWLRGFLIPKGAILVPNFWAIFRDPTTWPEPDAFKPERFLNDEGMAVKADELMPFSTGRRSCIGEHLAKMELFIFFSHFMHRFTFREPAGSPPLTLVGRGGLSRSPVPFELCAVQRDNEENPHQMSSNRDPVNGERIRKSDQEERGAVGVSK